MPVGFVLFRSSDREGTVRNRRGSAYRGAMTSRHLLCVFIGTALVCSVSACSNRLGGDHAPSPIPAEYLDAVQRGERVDMEDQGSLVPLARRNAGESIVDARLARVSGAILNPPRCNASAANRSQRNGLGRDRRRNPKRTPSVGVVAALHQRIQTSRTHDLTQQTRWLRR